MDMGGRGVPQPHTGPVVCGRKLLCCSHLCSNASILQPGGDRDKVCDIAA